MSKLGIGMTHKERKEAIARSAMMILFSPIILIFLGVLSSLVDNREHLEKMRTEMVEKRLELVKEMNINYYPTGTFIGCKYADNESSIPSNSNCFARSFPPGIIQ